jgi:hypothetical protein
MFRGPQRERRIERIPNAIERLQAKAPAEGETVH